jgi:integrase
MAQAEAVLTAAAGTRMHAYIVVSLLTGARIGELRALTWDHVHLVGQHEADPPVPPMWKCGARSGPGGHQDPQVPPRTLALPARCVDALRELQEHQGARVVRACVRIVDQRAPNGC